MSGLHAYTAHDVAKALGGEVIGRNKVSAPGPGHSRQDRSLAVDLKPGAPDDFVVFSHAGDDAMACRDYVRQMLGVPEWKPRERAERTDDPIRRMQERARSRQVGDSNSDDTDAAARQRKVDLALRIWGECVSPAGTLVETYLASRGLWLPDIVMRGGHLRFHPACAFKLEDGSSIRLPSMVCLMTDAMARWPQAIHRTALAPDGSGKAVVPGLGEAKKMLGPARGCVIRLCPDDEVTGALGLTEGVENAVAVMCAGWAPVWAAGTAGLVRDFPVLSAVETLTIFADTGEAGEKAADACGTRWHAAGQTVEAVFPKAGDWNDTIKGDAR